MFPSRNVGGSLLVVMVAEDIVPEGRPRGAVGMDEGVSDVVIGSPMYTSHIPSRLLEGRSPALLCRLLMSWTLSRDPARATSSCYSPQAENTGFRLSIRVSGDTNFPRLPLAEITPPMDGTFPRSPAFMTQIRSFSQATAQEYPKVK